MRPKSLIVAEQQFITKRFLKIKISAPGIEIFIEQKPHMRGLHELLLMKRRGFGLIAKA
jgi:hypothetical protein